MGLGREPRNREPPEIAAAGSVADRCAARRRESRPPVVCASAGSNTCADRVSVTGCDPCTGGDIRASGGTNRDTRADGNACASHGPFGNRRRAHRRRAKSSAPSGASPVAAAEPAPPASLQQQPASLPKEDVVFVQKPGVRMRSEPGRHGKVIGTPAKGSQFKIVGRAGSWVQVEGDAGRGWIGGRMLGPQSP